MPPVHRGDVRRHFGDSAGATAEFSHVSLGLGMVPGFLLGLIPYPVPGVGKVTLGTVLGHAAHRQHRAAQLRAGAVPRGRGRLT
jgi:hypothetical protein